MRVLSEVFKSSIRSALSDGMVPEVLTIRPVTMDVEDP
jgi:hypothetical protein